MDLQASKVLSQLTTLPQLSLVTAASVSSLVIRIMQAEMSLFTRALMRKTKTVQKTTLLKSMRGRMVRLMI